jgi:ligand-binding sensor domain-containing protein/signal transduction histidine kinase
VFGSLNNILFRVRNHLNRIKTTFYKHIILYVPLHIDPQMKFKFYFIVTLVMIFLSGGSRLFSQNIIFNTVSPPKGASWGIIVGITQDPKGYLWIASAFNGVFKYDGYQVTQYQKDTLSQNSINSNRVECIYADRQGIIWIGTFMGLDRFDPAANRFTHFYHSINDTGSISDNEISCILEDHEGKLWIGTGDGLNLLNKQTGKFIRYKYDPLDSSSMTNGTVRIIYEDRRGEIWVGCGDPSDNNCKSDCGGLNRFNRLSGKFTRFRHNPSDPHSLADSRVRAVLEDSRGNFWIGTAGKDGLYFMDRNKGTFERQVYDPANPWKLSRPPIKKHPFQDDFITFIREDKIGGIWIGSLVAGLTRYDPKTQKVSRYHADKKKEGFSDTTSWWSYTTQDGILWISSWEGNLFKVDPYHNNFHHVDLDKYVLSMQEDNAGVLWLGTNRGLIRFDPSTGLTQQFLYDGKRDNYIRTLIIDRTGKLWLKDNQGVCSFNRQLLTHKRYQNDPNDNHTISRYVGAPFLEDDKGYLWLATDSGLDRMDLQTEVFTHFSKSFPFKRWDVSCLEKDNNGDFWVGVWGGGLYRLNPQLGKYSQYLPNANVACILTDQEGILWAGTDAALYMSRDHAHFSRFLPGETELPINGVASLLEDDQKNLWINTQRGIVRLNPRRNKMNIYDAGYGINIPDFNWLYSKPFPSVKGRNGKIYFGDESGIYIMSREELKSNPNNPQINISKFSLQTQKSKSSTGTQDSELPIKNSQVVLSYNQNAFSINFVGIHFSSPSDNRHFFILENYDQDWRASGSEHSAYYYNVPPGHYIFRVKASNSDGVWAEKSISIIINPPWWRTWWAYCIYGLLFIALAFSFHRYQQNRIIMAEREKTRVRELAQAKEIEKAYGELKSTQAQLIQSEKMASLGELTAGIAHEIQNPLNFINNFSDVNKELIEELEQEIDHGNKENLRSIAMDVKSNEEKIAHHGKRADAIVKGMLQHSRTSAGQKESTDINALTGEYLRISYHGLRARDKSFNAAMQTDFDPAMGRINIIPQDIGRVLLNLFNNAFYAVNEKKKKQPEEYEPGIVVNTKKTGEKILISVRDNGEGISQRIIDKIFQPFFTTKPTGQGTGLGLSLSYDIIKAHGGEIKVETREGEFTEFTIQIPAV